jgi:hypothetical protein
MSPGKTSVTRISIANEHSSPGTGVSRFFLRSPEIYFFLLTLERGFFAAGLAWAFVLAAAAGFFAAGTDLCAGLACAFTCAALAGFGAGFGAGLAGAPFCGCAGFDSG